MVISTRPRYIDDMERGVIIRWDVHWAGIEFLKREAGERGRPTTPLSVTI